MRLGVPGRATYSELHEALRPGTPAADTVRRIQRIQRPAPLWRMGGGGDRAAAGDWQTGLLALTRLAELRTRRTPTAPGVSAPRSRPREENPFPGEPRPQARRRRCRRSRPIILERRRAVEGDSAVLADILGRLQSKQYDHGDAWVLGRLGAGRGRLALGALPVGRHGGVQGPLPDAALLLHRSVADPAAVAGLRRAGQLRAAASGTPSGRRMACSGSGRARACRRCSTPAPRRGRGACTTTRASARRPGFSGERQLVGDQPDGEVADGVGGGAGGGQGPGHADGLADVVIPSAARDLLAGRCSNSAWRGPSLRSG